MSAEGRERFFRAIAERIDVDRVEEVHVFPAIRQGGRESGVAVMTIRLEEPESSEQPTGPEESATSDDAVAPDAPGLPGTPEASDASEHVADSAVAEFEEDPAVSEPETDPALAALVDDLAPSESEADSVTSESAVVESFAADELAENFMEAPVPTPVPPPRRFTVLRAHYVLMLKGPERGKWEVGVVEEADAPAATVDEVVRGVHERAGGWGGDAEVPERLTGDDFRAALVEEPWTASP